MICFFDSRTKKTNQNLTKNHRKRFRKCFLNFKKKLNMVLFLLLKFPFEAFGAKIYLCKDKFDEGLYALNA